MASSDEEAEAVPRTVSNYEFVDDKDEPVSFAELKFQWNKTESFDGNKRHVFLRGTADKGLQKIYMQVTTWKFDFSHREPEISVLSKENDWIKLEKPRKAFQDTIRTILITVHSLQFLNKNPESSAKALWDHLSKVFSLYEPRPSENDLVDHMNFINEIVTRDERLAQSKVLLAFLEKKPRKKKMSDEVGSKISEFIVDDIIMDDNEEEEEEDDDDGYNHFESLCAICDDGGELLCCDGKCLRSFHATEEDGAESQCASLRFTKAQVRAMKYQDFYCKNCEHQQHQCYACGKLGSSDLSSHAEVFRCVNATCGHFYHPHCVARLLHPDAQGKVDDLKKKIASGEPFACPLHQCAVCKLREDKDKPELQFAMCRRCPTSYHRKCLPKEIVFDKSKDEDEEDEEEEDEDDDVLPRAWDDLIPNRILIYCLKHEIDEELATPLRNHIKFPGDHRRAKQTPEQTGKLKGVYAEVTDGKRLIAKKTKTVEKSSEAVKEDFSRKRERGMSLPDSSSSKRQKVIDATRRKSLNTTSSSVKLNKPVHNEGKASLGEQLYAYMSRESETHVGSSKEKKTKTIKSLKKETGATGSQPLDAAAKNRILSMMKDVKTSVTMDKLVKHKVPTTHAYTSKFDKSITLGKVEGSVEAIRAALQILDEGGKVEDAKAVCEPGLLDQIMKWRSKLRVYLAPFLYGMRYTSYGRHFTKVEKLREITNMLHWYVENGDMIVDFCCGSNDFSCLMKKKLDEVGKDCSYKNFDIFKAKNDFNFEKRDWMSVRQDELPNGSKLIMGLNPPFGVNAGLANKFINKALEFKPKLLILIVPKETERCDVKVTPYDLIWEDDVLLGGKSFYLPGSVDSNDKQMEDWNVSAPPLYLWSHPDWTDKHKAIAQQHGHPSNIQKGVKLEESDSHAKGDDVKSPRMNEGNIGFEDKKRHHKPQSNGGKEGAGSGRKKSADEKSKKGSWAKSKKQQDLDEKPTQVKSNLKRQRDVDEKLTENKSAGKGSLSRHSSPSVAIHKSVGGSASPLQTEQQQTGYGAHQDGDMERRRNLQMDEHPRSSLDHEYHKSANPAPTYVDIDMVGRRLPIPEPYSSLNHHQYSQPSASPGSEYPFRASNDQFTGYQRESVEIPGYGAHTNDRRPQGNLYSNEFLNPKSSYVAGASTGYSSYGGLSPTADPTYGRSNFMPEGMRRFDELNPARMESETRSSIYGSGVARPGPQGNTSGFAARPYYSSSQHSSSGWLNE